MGIAEVFRIRREEHPTNLLLKMNYFQNFVGRTKMTMCFHTFQVGQPTYRADLSQNYRTLRPSARRSAHVSKQVLWFEAVGPNGFDIELTSCGSDFVVKIGGLEQHVDTEKDALKLVQLACRPTTRLRTDCMGKRAVQWVMEVQSQAGSWIEVAASGYFIWFRRYRLSHCTYLVNEGGVVVSHSPNGRLDISQNELQFCEYPLSLS
jgi:hypothetical protein